MKKIETIDRMLCEIPISEILSCTKEDEKGVPKVELSIKSKYPKHALESNIPESRRTGLKTLFYKNSRKAIEEIIRYRFEGREILSAYEGDASIILPTKQHQFHRDCVSFEAGGYQIYFSDFAIPVFRSTILRLDERSKRDSFHFIKGKLESGQSQHLHLSMTESHNQARSRTCMLLENKDKHCQDPENALYYYTNFKSDGTLDVGDLENILELIEIFAKTYGEFGMIKHTDKECFGYNVGSLKITGTDKVLEPIQKVYSLRKKED